MYSLSYINFTTDATVTPSQLGNKDQAVPCEYKVSEHNDTLWDYTEITDSTCSFC